MSGHIKADDVKAIAFVTFPETKMPSIAFFNNDNETKFTIYVGYELVDGKISILESAKKSFYQMKEEFTKK